MIQFGPLIFSPVRGKRNKQFLKRNTGSNEGRFPFNKNYRFKFSEFSLVEWNASDRFPEFEVTCSVIQGMLGVFENGGLFKHFRGFRGG